MTEKKYFAAANTVGGFVSYYGDIFENCDRIYVIKGGSGTGKSRFMMEVADYVSKNTDGAGVEYFYCSFDPDSLDGIIIDRRIALIDGTAPHVYEPTVPGAKEDLIDLGAFWNSRALAEKKSEILSLMGQKKECFKRAYSYLSAYGELMSARETILLPFVDQSRLCADAAKRVSEIERNGEGEGLVRPTSAFGRYGIIGEIPKKEETGLEYLWLSHIIGEAGRFNMSFEISYHPLFACRPMRVTMANGAVFSTSDIDLTEYMTGDFQKAMIKANETVKTADEILCLAERELSEASDIHFGIEEIYVSAMDFEKKEAFTKEFLKKLEI